jgi:hypothetical protein
VEMKMVTNTKSYPGFGPVATIAMTNLLSHLIFGRPPYNYVWGWKPSLRILNWILYNERVEFTSPSHLVSRDTTLIQPFHLLASFLTAYSQGSVWNSNLTEEQFSSEKKKSEHSKPFWLHTEGMVWSVNASWISMNVRSIQNNSKIIVSD